MKRQKRRIKLIQPRLQLKLTFVFLGLSASSMLLQFILFTSNITELASYLPTDGLVLVEALPNLLYGTLLVSFGLFLPMIFFVGVLVTFRIAGPLYRFEVYLKQVIRGEKPADCRLRKGDELQELCKLINLATEPLRRHDPETAGAEPPKPVRSLEPVRDEVEAAA